MKRMLALSLCLLGLALAIDCASGLQPPGRRRCTIPTRRPIKVLVPRRPGASPPGRPGRPDHAGARRPRHRRHLHREARRPEPRDAGKLRRPLDLRQYRRRSAPTRRRPCSTTSTSGGGFVPVHCASYCFLNSPEYIALVGAQFQRHGTGEFDTKIVDPSHPIMKGFVPFRTWDETYVHTKHNEKDRHVLQMRAEGTTEEPWTWVRTQGKGRVFYTAYGHDARTWQNPGFHDLVERGIRWASAKGEVFDSRGRVAAGLPPFTYDESPAEIPNYLPGRQWGTQGEPIRKMQKPLSPEESMQAPGRARRLRAAALRRRARDLQAALHDLGPPRPALDRREHRLSQHQAPRRPGPRPDHDLRRHRRRRPGRLVQGLRRGPQHPHQPAVCQTAA